MNRCVVSYATGRYIKGLERLDREILSGPHGAGALMVPWGIGPWPNAKDKHKRAGSWPIPKGWPTHEQIPYGFKAHALHEAAASIDVLLWADACIRPIRSMKPLWERIERDGYWFSNNGWSNYDWTADSAYPDLFTTEDLTGCGDDKRPNLEAFREFNRKIPHVVATAFGVNVKHPQGKAFLDEYFRLASETKAFCGPWWNESNPDCPGHHEGASRFGICGPSDVRGHRHDQTAASVIAWRLGFELTNPPDIFSYVDGQSESTILVADGAY